MADKPTYDELEQRMEERTAELVKATEQLEAEIEQRQQAEDALKQIDFELEELVQKRTVELERANEKLQSEIAERKFLEGELLLKNIVFEMSVAANSTADRDGVINHVNPAFLKMWGYETKEETIGHPVPHFFQDPDDAVPVMEALNESGMWEGEFVAKRKDGSTFISRGLATVVHDEAGRQIGYYSTNLDVTEEKRAEAEIRELNATLEERVTERTAQLAAANEQLRAEITERKRAEEERKQLEGQLHEAQKMQAIGTLAGGIAHYFNNLLLAIQARASLMLLHIDSDHPNFQRLKGIEDSVRKGVDLTKELLGFARGGKYEVKATDLNELVDKGSEMFGRTKKEIKIHSKLQKDIWPVEVYQGQIEQALLNICLNAWQAMPRGGDLYIETSNVVLDEKDTKAFGVGPGKYVKTCVADTGKGMDLATRQRVFDPFFTTKEMSHGTGLGLASAYGIIKNHGGFISVYSKKGEGTAFKIFLPASEKELKTKEDKLSDEILKGTEAVLFVDDEDMILDVGQEILKEMGYKVLLARGGEEAVEVYRNCSDEIDLVILDMVMPRMGGGEAYDKMKEINPDIKVLLSSGYSIDSQATEILARGCDAFIQKPFSMQELSQKIRGVLEKE